MVWVSLAGIPAAKPPTSILAVLRGSPIPGIQAATLPAALRQNSIISVHAWVSPGRRVRALPGCWGLTALINSLSAADSAFIGTGTRKKANCKTSAIRQATRVLSEPADFGGNPAFANPFVDVSTGQTEANPFPYVYPAAGTPLNWPNYAELSISTYPNRYTVPYVYNFNLNHTAGTAVQHGPSTGLCGARRAVSWFAPMKLIQLLQPAMRPAWRIQVARQTAGDSLSISRNTLPNRRSFRGRRDKEPSETVSPGTQVWGSSSRTAGRTITHCRRA